MALSAVHKVLKHGLISEHNPDAAEAMHCIADAVNPEFVVAAIRDARERGLMTSDEAAKLRAASRRRT